MPGVAGSRKDSARLVSCLLGRAHPTPSPTPGRTALGRVPGPQPEDEESAVALRGARKRRLQERGSAVPAARRAPPPDSTGPTGPRFAGEGGERRQQQLHAAGATRRVTGPWLEATVESRGKSRVPKGSQSLNLLQGPGEGCSAGSRVPTAPSLQEGSLRPASSQPARILPAREATACRGRAGAAHLPERVVPHDVLLFADAGDGRSRSGGQGCLLL